MTKKIVALVGVLLGAAIVGAVAFAAWTSSGAGFGTAQSTQDKDSAITAEASAADLYPGAEKTVTVRITNPNDYPVIVTGISAGSSDAVKDCAADSVRSDARDNARGIDQVGDAGAVIEPNDSGVYELTTRMTNDPSNACKNQSFNLPLTASLASAATAQDF
ncbi:MAG: hypothetical protein JNK12_03855 [Acidimicrobiales bacterium]|nr:hypothetical protein [Acidimicrobiales bacterium]